MNIAAVLTTIASASWLLVVGVIVLVVMRAARARPIKNGTAMIIGVVVFSLILTTISAGLVFIQPDERGVVISAVSPLGYRENALEPGLHWIIPFAETVRTYTISRQTYTMSVAPSEGQIYGDDSIRARTDDGQEVYVDASVIFSINPEEVVQLHILWQDRYASELVRPLTRGIIRDMVSQYGVEEIVTTRRVELEISITEEMTIKLAENYLVMVDFVLRDIHFSEEYAAAVERKQIAEQEALQAEYIVEQRRHEADQARKVAEGLAAAVVIQAEGDAEARLIQAEAEAQALEMLADALRANPDLLTYLYVTKLSPNVEVMFLPSDTPFVFSLPETLVPK